MFVNSLSLINAKPLLNLFILKKQKIIAISIMSTSIPFIILFLVLIINIIGTSIIAETQNDI